LNFVPGTQELGVFKNIPEKSPRLYVSLDLTSNGIDDWKWKWKDLDIKFIFRNRIAENLSRLSVDPEKIVFQLTREIPRSGLPGFIKKYKFNRSSLYVATAASAYYLSEDEKKYHYYTSKNDPTSPYNTSKPTEIIKMNFGSRISTVGITNQFDRDNLEFSSYLPYRATLVPYRRFFGPNFKYNTASITRKTDLRPYLTGTAKPTAILYSPKIDFDFRKKPIWYRNYTDLKNQDDEIDTFFDGSVNTSLISSTGWHRFFVSDEEKIFLIRKKYGLNDIDPECCQNPGEKCRYIIDFSSEEFLKKIKDRCGQTKSKEEEDNDAKRSSIDSKSIPQHTGLQENRFQNLVETSYRIDEDCRRRAARGQGNCGTSGTGGTSGTAGYQGTDATEHNLAQLPRLGEEASIVGAVVNSTPLTDTQTTQQIILEAEDSENTDSVINFVNFVVDLYGNYNNLMAYGKWRVLWSSDSLKPYSKIYDVVYPGDSRYSDNLYSSRRRPGFTLPSSRYKP
jgi:hypothetical protein